MKKLKELNKSFSVSTVIEILSAAMQMAVIHIFVCPQQEQHVNVRPFDNPCLVLLDGTDNPVGGVYLAYGTLQQLDGSRAGTQVRQVVEEELGVVETGPGHLDASVQVGRRHFLGRVRLFKQLFGYLTKIVDEANGRIALQRVLDAEDVHVALVEEMVEGVVTLLGRLALLPGPENKVDPLVQVGRHVVRLQGLAVHTDKLPWVPLGPRRQDHVVQPLPVLFEPVVKVVLVL